MPTVAFPTIRLFLLALAAFPAACKPMGSESVSPPATTDSTQIVVSTNQGSFTRDGDLPSVRRGGSLVVGLSASVNCSPSIEPIRFVMDAPTSGIQLKMFEMATPCSFSGAVEVSSVVPAGVYRIGFSILNATNGHRERTTTANLSVLD